MNKIRKRDIISGNHNIESLTYIANRGMKITFDNYCNFLNWLYSTNYDFRNDKKLLVEYYVLKWKYEN
jgi:hypothetical protein